MRGLGIPFSTKTLSGTDKNGNVIHYKDDHFGDRFRGGYAYLWDRVPDLSANIDFFLTRPEPQTNPEANRQLVFALEHFSTLEKPVSRGRPSRSSSTSQWSWSQDVELEASGGNDGLLNGCCGFHTAYEQNPWWQVDLGAPHAIGRVTIYNRLDLPERCVNFDVLVSDNGVSWQTIFRNRDGKFFGGADGNPFRCSFPEPPFGRYFVFRLPEKVFCTWTKWKYSALLPSRSGRLSRSRRGRKFQPNAAPTPGAEAVPPPGDDPFRRLFGGSGNPGT